MHGAITLYFDGGALDNADPLHPTFLTSRAAWAFVPMGAAGQMLKAHAGPMPADEKLTEHTREWAAQHMPGRWTPTFTEGLGTNNMAELRAVYEALLWARKTGYKHVRLRGDSELAIKSLTGVYRISRLPWIAHYLFRISRLAAFELSPAEKDEHGFTRHRLRPLMQTTDAKKLLVTFEKVSDKKNRADKYARECLGRIARSL